MERRTYAKNRLRELRKAKGISQEDLGLQMDAQLSGSTIAKLENGRQALSVDYLLEIGRILGVDPAEIIMPREGTARFVPIIGMVAAGNWQEAIEMANEAMPIPSDVGGPNCFALRIEGDSMDKVVPDGGAIVVDPDQRDLVANKHYVVMNAEGETTFKKVSTDPLALLPCSSNPAHRAIMVGSEPFTVVGRVVFAGHEV